MSVTPGLHSAPVPTTGWLLQTWRLTRWNLFLAWRRLMSKILLTLLLSGLALLIGGQMLFYLLISTVPVSTGTPCPTPAATSQTTQGPGTGPQQPCVGPSPEEEQQARQAQQEAAALLQKNLTFPTILGPVTGFLSFFGVILLCILLGALVGSEYSFGTQRLALARGISRAQVFVAQVLALAVLALLIVGSIFALSSLAGLLLGLALQVSTPPLSLAGWGELVTIWLATSLTLFAYGLIALFLATLGRSPAAGIAGSLGYLLVELIVLPIVAAIAEIIGGDTGHSLNQIQNAFLSTNTSAMLAGAASAPLPLSSGSTGMSALQGLLVTLAYCALCMVLSYWLLRKRDVTN